MAYDRHDTRHDPRDDERSRRRDERFEGRDRDRSGRDDRGFFERAGNEIASWFGDDDPERRRPDQRMEGRDRGMRRDEDRTPFYGRDRDEDRGRFERDEERRPRGNEPDADRGYRPMAGDYTRSDPGEFRSRERERGDHRERGSASLHDPHYEDWRRRQVDEFDRDYEDYRRENQARFESDFGSWREQRMRKRGLLGQIREHMAVVGNDDQNVGTVDRVAGERIILTKSDAESGGAHHSLSCADLNRVEGDRLILDCSAEQARERWRDESRGRALFEREDQGEMGDRALNRSFPGTYR